MNAAFAQVPAHGSRWVSEKFNVELRRCGRRRQCFFYRAIFIVARTATVLFTWEGTKKRQGGTTPSENVGDVTYVIALEAKSPIYEPSGISFGGVRISRRAPLNPQLRPVGQRCPCRIVTV